MHLTSVTLCNLDKNYINKTNPTVLSVSNITHSDIKIKLQLYFGRSGASTHQLSELCSTQVNFPALCSACHSSLVGHVL